MIRLRGPNYIGVIELIAATQFAGPFLIAAFFSPNLAVT
jgi:hypothetical protein